MQKHSAGASLLFKNHTPSLSPVLFESSSPQEQADMLTFIRNRCLLPKVLCKEFELEQKIFAPVLEALLIPGSHSEYMFFSRAYIVFICKQECICAVHVQLGSMGVLNRSSVIKA